MKTEKIHKSEASQSEAQEQIEAITKAVAAMKKAQAEYEEALAILASKEVALRHATMAFREASSAVPGARRGRKPKAQQAHKAAA